MIAGQGSAPPANGRVSGSMMKGRGRGVTSAASGGSVSGPGPGWDLILEKLGTVPFRLYLGDVEGGFQATGVSGLDLDRRDPWTLELETSGPWEHAAERRGPSVLADIPRRGGLAEPDPGFLLLPAGEPGRPLGGLLIHTGSGKVGARLARTLTDPGFLHLLELHLRLTSALRDSLELGQFRMAVSSVLPYGLLTIDHLGRVVYAGGQTESILGLPAEQILGSDCARVFRPLGPGPNPLLEGLRRRLDPMELYLSRPDGGEIPVHLQTARVSLGTGRRGLVAFFQDKTEELTLDEAERQRDRLAILGELSAGVAHEIRNPLTGIANCAQVLAEGMDPEDSHQRFTRIILDEVGRLNRIVEGLLSYARPSRPELREASVEEVARRAIEMVRASAEAGGIRLSMKVRARIPRIFIDPEQIEQVLLNLLRNAVEAMPNGGEVGLELGVARRRRHRRRSVGRRAGDRGRARPAGGPLVRFVQVRVSDSGHGIPKEMLSRVFNPFFTTRSKGTGLGLSLSQSIVREHGGFLTARSVVKKGTTFQLDLPVERRQGERRKDSR